MEREGKGKGPGLGQQLGRLASMPPGEAAFDLWVGTPEGGAAKVLSGGGGRPDSCYAIAVGEGLDADSALAIFPDCVNADSLYVFADASDAACLASIMAEHPELWSGASAPWGE